MLRTSHHPCMSVSRRFESIINYELTTNYPRLIIKLELMEFLLFVSTVRTLNGYENTNGP
jgi:hypothetical protein